MSNQIPERKNKSRKFGSSRYRIDDLSWESSIFEESTPFSQRKIKASKFSEIAISKNLEGSLKRKTIKEKEISIGVLNENEGVSISLKDIPELEGLGNPVNSLIFETDEKSSISNAGVDEKEAIKNRETWKITKLSSQREVNIWFNTLSAKEKVFF